MRTLLIVVLGISLGGVLPTAHAEDPPDATSSPAQVVLDALEGAETGSFIGAIAADTDEAKGAAAALAKNPAGVQKITALQLKRQEALAKRDDDGAVTTADWIVRLAAATRKASPKDAAALTAMWQANLARGRIGIARERDVRAKHWTTAADYILASEAKLPLSHRQDEAFELALSLLQEAGKGKSAPFGTLADHSAKICRRLLKVAPEREEVRRSVAGSFKWQSEIHADSSRKSMQAAIGGYFEAFAPIAKEDGADQDDQRAWNAMVSVFRRAKMDVKVDYISRRCRGAGNALSYQLPRTASWSGSGAGSFRQVFEDKSLYRSVTFNTYSWDSVYGFKDSPRDVGGDNVKGIAGRNFERKLRVLTDEDRSVKIKKKKKPKRKKFNKTLPAGIEYLIEYEDREGTKGRIRVFFCKSVKAELTVMISIFESGSLKGDHPEWLDVIASFDVTKKSR